MPIRWLQIVPLLGLLALLGGCSTIRVTNPEFTATQLFLESEATHLAVQRISVDQLRDRKVYIDTTYLTTLRENSEALSFRQVPQEYLFLVADLRAKLLLGGVRLVDRKQDADIVLEVRTGGVGVDYLEFLLGLSSITVPTEGVASIPFETPELALVKSVKQFGFASVAIVAYWQDTGEVVVSSGPFVGRTAREDYWLFGLKTHTVGNIPPAQKPPPEVTK